MSALSQFLLLFQSSDMSDVDMSSLVSSEVTPPSASSNMKSEFPQKTGSKILVKQEPRDEHSPQGRAGGQQQHWQQRHHQRQQPQPQARPIPRPMIRANRTSDGQSKMVLGQTALAGIVISSGPDGHFETYEGEVSREFFVPGTFDKFSFIFSHFPFCYL